MRILLAGILSTTLAVTSAALYGHHSFPLLFDGSRTVTVEGTVSKFEFIYPHSYIHLEVPGDDGVPVLWQIETSTPGMLTRRGWSRDTLKGGDRIVCTGYPTRDGRPLMRLDLIVLPDGTEQHIRGRPQ